MSQILLRPRAKRDVEELWDILAEGAGSQTADRFVRKLYRRFTMLADYPLAGRDRSDLRQGLRGSTVGRYIIFYDPIEHGILISRIVYGGRDLPTLFGEEAADDA